jgi:hypothetical protein
MRRIAIVGLAVLSAAGLVACSDKVDREGTVDEMVEQGIPREQAECMVDRLVDELGDERALELNDTDQELTAEEEELMGEVVLECTEVSVPAE